MKNSEGDRCAGSCSPSSAATSAHGVLGTDVRGQTIAPAIIIVAQPMAFRAGVD